MAGASKISNAGIAAIKRREGFKGVTYWINGIPHIGYGFNKLYHALPDAMTRAQADQYILQILNSMYEPEVRNINAALTQNQYDALVSFKYNVGHIPNNLKTPVSQGEHKKAANYIANNYTQGGQLLARRKDEASQYLGGSNWLIIGSVILIGFGIFGFTWLNKRKKKQ